MREQNESAMSMSHSTRPAVRVGLAMPPKPPLAMLRRVLFAARLLRLDAFMVWDRLEDLFPRALWQPDIVRAADGASPHQFYDFQTTLGALARDAGHVRLGVAVAEAIRRHPVIIAQALLTLAHLTERAPILGLGAGERANLDPYGLSFVEPVARLEEAIQVIRLLFDGTAPHQFQGRFFALEAASFALRPPAGRTPRLWLGGQGPRLLRLTGEYGDGWYPVGSLTPAAYADKLAVIHRAATNAGRDPQRIAASFQPTLVVAPTTQAARRLLEHPLIRYLGLLLPATAWDDLGYQHPFGAGYRGYFDLVPERVPEREMRAAIATVPVEALSAIGLIWGTPNDVLRRMDDYVEAGARHFVPQVPALAISRRAAAYQTLMIRRIAARYRG